ncbi:MAG: glycosyltransferase family 4 protein [Desulfobacteraceae bacterium]|jgi:glycosyltransferase involved in cell wall biosynthesis
MRIAYFMPFKPLGHANPSGDLIIGSELVHVFKEYGHQVRLISRLRSRWIYWKPWQVASLPIHFALACKKVRQIQADIWLSYHSYYKAPDLLGPFCTRYLNLPYIIFQGIYATKYRRRLTTFPGFWLNRFALLAADLVFTNKHNDFINLKRIIPHDRLSFVAPGIRIEMFRPCGKARLKLRKRWDVMDKPVIITAAMFRPGVKTRGIQQVIDACNLLYRNGIECLLVIIGDGENREILEQAAKKKLPRRHIFLGKIPREQLQFYFSAADLFVFPGIEESLGMVYLEAQACGLPVVALKQWGAGEAVLSGQTGILVKKNDIADFAEAIATLLKDADLREKMGQVARRHVLQNHDVHRNYANMIMIIENLWKHRKYGRL